MYILVIFAYCCIVNKEENDGCDAQSVIQEGGA